MLLGVDDDNGHVLGAKPRGDELEPAPAALVRVRVRVGVRVRVRVRVGVRVGVRAAAALPPRGMATGSEIGT